MVWFGATALIEREAIWLQFYLKESVESIYCLFEATKVASQHQTRGIRPSLRLISAAIKPETKLFSASLRCIISPIQFELWIQLLRIWRRVSPNISIQLICIDFIFNFSLSPWIVCESATQNMNHKENIEIGSIIKCMNMKSQASLHYGLAAIFLAFC